MPLVNLPLPPLSPGIPPDVLRYLREADARIEEYQVETRCPAFVPCDFEGTFRVLRALSESTLLRGPRFCEWGSGFGVATGLAGLLDFDACGIEIEPELVAAARQLADEFELAVEFVAGSFVPRGAEDRVLTAGNYAWLTTDGDDAYIDLGLDPDDMDLVFSYPWPDEEAITASLFERYSGAGAILLTYHGGDDFRARRKVDQKRRRR